MNRGFTLIEISIVLVIIGLVVGGVLVGQDLLRAAAVRAQISQIEKYQTAVNTFIGKYGALPGDMNAATASQFGFAARGPSPGQGDGNGLIQGYDGSHPTSPFCEGQGETVLFWQDLSGVQLIELRFNGASWSSCSGAKNSNGSLKNYLPQAQFDSQSYVYAYSSSGLNYFAVSRVQYAGGGSPWGISGMPIWTAYLIDAKIDNGLPQSGNVTAQYLRASKNTQVNYGELCSRRQQMMVWPIVTNVSWMSSRLS